ncbi:hypothetical protein KFZ76_01915 [Methylovulum psychrotolerans]|uniref:choice-of-anchor tandem repeat GloVer-containing protein n=1 Tax=Methylovulum psychrotolerans TaxID=1704499 RepID=UPI001BFFCA25|nr:choice-of-anchor tandem repeat GloVer-containing protein [Methylovulum psychrotolerans]MBT9096464.1 hypothetical protein [Methylovulum psychrotolerans]
MQTKTALSSSRQTLSRWAIMPLLIAALSAPVQAAQLTTLVDFNGSNGQVPFSELVSDASGNLYGTTSQGGTSNIGTAFRLSPPTAGQSQWTLTTLANFNPTSGGSPLAALVKDVSGNLYGTTSQGGAKNWGAVFKLSPPAAGQSQWTLATLVNFGFSNGADPMGGLVRDTSGNLYGTTAQGGANAWGTAFKVSPPAVGKTKWTLTTLTTFNIQNGGSPMAGLIMDASGNLYGTTITGGSNSSGSGTVFRLSPPAAGKTKWTRTTLATFNGTNGAVPAGKLLLDASGNLYGTTTTGTISGLGTVFKLSSPAAGQTRWKLTTLTTFNGTNGGTPTAGLVKDTSGNLYGTTSGQRTTSLGTVFKLSPPVAGQTKWTLTTLVGFNDTDGRMPTAGLMRDTAGNLYGTTTAGGAYGFGTVFKVSP